MNRFDDARLDAADVAEHEALRRLAGAGARIRTAALCEPIGRIDLDVRPRGVIAVGHEARLLRAVLEPVCPVPFVAWPAEGLPGWVGPLDLVVVLGSVGVDQAMVATAREAVRRGAALIVAAPESSDLAVLSASRSTLLLPTSSEDATAAAVAVLAVLGRMGLGPRVVPDEVADAADLLAESASPLIDLAHNPAKALALALGDDLPLVCGETVLAARAGRRIAEAVRAVTGRAALAADADDVQPMLARLERRDLFADPFDEPASDRFPVLIVLEDRGGAAVVSHESLNLVRQAEALGVRVHTVRASADVPGGDVGRYVSLLQHGLFGAAYLGIGVGNH